MNWIDIKKQKPIATKSGCWDGLKSEPILVTTRSEKYYVVTMYAGSIDGEEFCNFYDDRDFEITNITHWCYISSIQF